MMLNFLFGKSNYGKMPTANFVPSSCSEKQLFSFKSLGNMTLCMTLCSSALLTQSIVDKARLVMKLASFFVICVCSALSLSFDSLDRA